MSFKILYPSYRGFAFKGVNSVSTNLKMKKSLPGICATIVCLVSSVMMLSSCEEDKKVNRAITFDGVDDYIDLGDVYDDLALPVTVSAWVWIDPAAPDGYLPVFATQVGGDTYYGVSMNTSNVASFAIQYGDGEGGNNSIYRRSKSATMGDVKGSWINITAVMRSATDMDVLLNGVKVTGTLSGSSDLPLDSNAPAYEAHIAHHIGDGAEYFFKGSLDEVRIWNRSLTESEIREAVFTEINKNHEGLIGYWNFDEESGSVLKDNSSNRFNGTLMGNPTRIKSGVPLN